MCQMDVLNGLIQKEKKKEKEKGKRKIVKKVYNVTREASGLNKPGKVLNNPKLVYVVFCSLLR